MAPLNALELRSERMYSAQNTDAVIKTFPQWRSEVLSNRMSTSETVCDNEMKNLVAI